MELTAALDGLQKRGVLQALNRMSLEELLNPVAESHTMDETSDEKIYRVVMEAQHGNLMTNDDTAEDDLVLDPPPTCHEALQAILVITKYVEAMDEPLAQTLEKNLGSFQHLLHSVELKSMVPSRLTDYFTLKPN